MSLFLAVLLSFAAGEVQASNTLKFVSYNVENLHDTEHDEGKDDWEYLPLNHPGKAEACEKVRSPYYRKLCKETDWTDKKLALKLKQIEKAVFAAAGGVSPDLLALSEVENRKVVDMLAERLGMSQVYVTESPDERGMDVALIVNLKKGMSVAGSRELIVAGIDKPTRNVLEVKIKLPGNQFLYVYVNHWPSQAAPAFTRVAAARAVADAVTEKRKQEPTAAFLVVGDFNVTPEDRPDPFDSIFLSQKELAFMDLNSEYRKLMLSKKNYTALNSMPPGSYYYAVEMTWNLLDRVFFSRNLVDDAGIDVNVESYKIVTDPFLRTSYTYEDKHYLAGSIVQGIPYRYDFSASNMKSAGYSDHFPVYFELTTDK